MTTVYLVRHGHVEYPLDAAGRRLIYGPDVHLSQIGREAVMRLATQFNGKSIELDAIYHSPYVRAEETAAILARSLVIARIEKIEALRDILNPDWIGFPLEEYLREFNGDTYGLADGRTAETLEQVATRVTTAFYEIVGKEEGKSIAIVSHGDPLRVLIARLLNPDGALPPMKELSQSDYLGPAEAWQLHLDGSARLLEKEYIGRPPEQWGRGERKL